MASPQSVDRFTATPASGNIRPLSLTPGSRVLDTPSYIRTPLSNESIGRRLKEAGFDEESIKRRDKAALIAYIAKLEAEIYDLQHNMGLLILEKKEWASKIEEVKLSSEAAAVAHKRDLSALSSALSEAKKQEDNLKKALGIERECVANIEKALHEMRAERAEDKLAADSKIDEARKMTEDAQTKFVEAEAKRHAAESLQAEVSRFNRAAERKLQEVESREDDLRRRMVSFKSDCVAKAKEIMLERQSLIESQRVLNESQDRLLEGQAILNQREAEMLIRSQELSKSQRELERSKERINAERRALMDEKSSLELTISSLSEREKTAIEKEALLNRKEQELLISQEKFSSKEHDRVKRLMAEQENALRAKKDKLESEVAAKYKLAEEEIQAKRRAWELKEFDLKQREDQLFERELELDVQSRTISDKGREVANGMRSFEEKEKSLNKAKEDVEQKSLLLRRKEEEISRRKIELEEELHTIDEKRKYIEDAEASLEVMTTETSELHVLEANLKEEIDSIRSQKVELEADSEKLKVEKAKFESEWELIDEKREELHREEMRIAGERSIISRFLKDERDSLNLEKAAMRDQYKQDLESLCHDREDFLNEMKRERSELVLKIQQERSDFLLDFELRKRELEDCLSKRREEIESYLIEKERAVEEERKKELEKINSLKEALTREQEYVMLEMKKLEAERVQINVDHVQRYREWADLNILIDELKIQQKKLKEQRELLHADREGIYSQIEHLEKLENLKIPSDKIVVPEIQQSTVVNGEAPTKLYLGRQQWMPEGCSERDDQHDNKQGSDCASPPSSSAFSRLVQRCASLFKNSSDGLPFNSEEGGPVSYYEAERRRFDERTNIGKDEGSRLEQEVALIENEKGANNGIFGRLLTTVSTETRVIHEVPHLDGNVQQKRDMGAEISLDVSGNSMHTSSKNTTGRKRRVEKPPAPGGDVDAAEEVSTNKKRKQENDAHHSGEATPSCSELKQSDNADPEVEVLAAAELPSKLTGSGVSDKETAVDLFPNAEVGSKEDTWRDGSLIDPDTYEQVQDATVTVIEEQTTVSEMVIEEITTCTEKEAGAVPEQGDKDHVKVNMDKPEKGNDRPKRRAKPRQKS